MQIVWKEMQSVAAMDSEITDHVLLENLLPASASLSPSDKAAVSQHAPTSTKNQQAGVAFKDEWPPAEKMTNSLEPFPTNHGYGKCSLSCNDDCLCHLVAQASDSVVTDDTTDDIIHSIDVDDIYQVLGKDVLKSSLLDDVGLYLECDEDSLYSVSPKPEKGRGFCLPKVPKRGQFKYRVTFLLPKHEEKEIFLCDRCAKIFKRENLLKDHLAVDHGMLGLFPCSQCEYVGKLYRHWQKHFVRQHLHSTKKRSHQNENLNLDSATQSSGTGSKELLKSRNPKPQSAKQQLKSPTKESGLSGTALVTDTTHVMNLVESVKQGTCLNTWSLQAHTNSFSSQLVDNEDLPAVQKVTPAIFVEIIKVGEVDGASSSAPVLVLSGSSSQEIPQSSTESSASGGRPPGWMCSHHTCTAGRSTKRKRQLEVAASLAPKAAKFHCEKCSQTFKRHRSFVSHMNQHFNNLNYQCPHCPKRFASSENLRPHLKTHNKQKLPCNICQRTFKRNSALNEHMKTVHGPKNYKCGLCGKAYAFQRDLKAHENGHTSNFRCSWPKCGACFRDNYNLKMHVQTHTGKKNRTCLYCSYTCIQKNAMDNHMKKHASEGSSLTGTVIL